LTAERDQKRKQLAQDLIDAKNEAAMMLQTHNISPGKEGMAFDEDQQMHATNKSQSQSQTNLFQKKKENLEDKARIAELIVSLTYILNHLYSLFVVGITGIKQPANFHSQA
jgi:hypothetical protein